MERRKAEARQAILADSRARDVALECQAPEIPNDAKKQRPPFSQGFLPKKKELLAPKPILPPKLKEKCSPLKADGGTPKSAGSNAKRQQIEDMFKSAPKRFERKPKANGAIASAILERAKRL